MEEADVLCTRIGIVATGQLICIGSQLRLKRRFGDGFRLKVALVTPAPVAAGTVVATVVGDSAGTSDDGRTTNAAQLLQDFVQREVCEDAKLVHQFKTQFTFMLPAASVKISVLFDKFTNAQQSELNVREWSVNQTSLEEVFVKLVEQHETMASDAAAAASGPTLRWSSS
jgi:ABC-type multidrug transport system ATPase subunit